MRPATVEIRVPISPTSAFFTMVHYLAASIRLNSPRFAESRIVVFVGDEHPSVDVVRQEAWAKHYPIEWVWIDPAVFARYSYYGTAVERLHRHTPSDVVLILDADTLVAGPIDEAVELAHREQALLGLIAHVSPFLTRKERPPEVWWREVFAAAGLDQPVLSEEHSGFGVMYSDPDARHCPPYFNGGVLFAPPSIFERLGSEFYRDLDAIESVLTSEFRCQLAIALAAARHRIRWQHLPITFNYPNDMPMYSRYGGELEDVRIFHYMRAMEFSKFEDFHDVSAVDRFLRRRDLSVVNERLANALRPVHQLVLADV